MNEDREGELDATTAASTMAWAVMCGMRGEGEAGVRMLQPLFDRGPLTAYRLATGLAGLAITPAKLRHPDADGFMAMALDVDEETGAASAVPTDELPPVQRAAARFMAAVANDDQQTAEAVFKTVLEAGVHEVGQFVSGLYGQAVMGAARLAELDLTAWPGPGPEAGREST